MIKKFLGECDKTEKNPKSKSKLKLYRIDRVNEVLADPSFKEWQNKKQSSTTKRKQSIVKVDAVQNIEVVLPAKPTAIAESVAKIDAFAFELGLSRLQTADWVDFQWEYFRVDDDDQFSEEKQLHAVTTVKKMLVASYWFDPQDFFKAFSQYGKGGAGSPDVANEYKSSILEIRPALPFAEWMLRAAFRVHRTCAKYAARAPSSTLHHNRPRRQFVSYSRLLPAFDAAHHLEASHRAKAAEPACGQTCRRGERLPDTRR
jgi:hypothetical protein